MIAFDIEWNTEDSIYWGDTVADLADMAAKGSVTPVCGDTIAKAVNR